MNAYSAERQGDARRPVIFFSWLAEEIHMRNRVAKPLESHRCWGLVKVAGCRAAQGMSQCIGTARPGFLTCPHHRKVEEDARLLKECLERATALSLEPSAA